MNKRLYVAYGSNLNFQQMKYRCQTARLYGTGIIKNYELQFKGYPNSAFATIAPKEGAFVPTAVWEIQTKDELALDRYEGYPSHYFKQTIPVQLADGREISAMVYIMNPQMDFGLPSPHYYQTVHEGYNDCGLDMDILNQALKNSAQQFYSSSVRHSQQRLFDDMDEEDEGEELDNDYDEELDKNNPFYFSDGIKL